MGLTLGAALGIGAGASAVNLGGSFLGSLFNKAAAEAALEKQVQASKDLLDYQMEKYSSPLAQMKQIGKAGLNPAAMFGNTAPVNVGGSMAMPNAPTYGLDVGTQSLSDVASLLVGAAQAKKAGVEVPNIEADTQSKLLDNDRKDFENTLLHQYGLEKTSAELALAWQNVKLAESSTDLNVQKKATESWSTAKEKALSEVSEKQRDILQKELDNKDTQLKLQNELLRQQGNTEKSKQSANYASAENQRQQAKTTESLRPHQLDAVQLENGLKAVDFDVKNATSELSKQEFIERVLNLMSQNRTGKAWTAMFGTSEVYPEDVELGSMYKAANALWEKYKQGVQQGIKKVESSKNH